MIKLTEAEKALLWGTDKADIARLVMMRTRCTEEQAKNAVNRATSDA